MIYVLARRPVVSVWLKAGFALALMLCSAAAGLCAAASDTPGPETVDLAQLSIEDLMNVTVVTAGKKPETIAKTAAAVFVITSDDIERYGYQTLSQALRRISGFYSEYDHVYDFIGVRGYLPGNDLNRRVLVLVDGHKVNDYLYGQAPVNQDLPVDMRDLERIEVVKGPGSALWGSEALLCVINCITKSASQIDGFKLRQDAGWSAGEHLAYGHTTPGGLEVTAALSQLTSQGQERIHFPDFDTPENNNGVAVGLDGERVGRGYLNMSYKGMKLSYNHVKRTKDVPTAFWGSVFNVPGVDITDERGSWEMSYENPAPYAGDGKLFCRIYRDNYDAVCNFTSMDETLVLNRGIDLSRAWGAEARYSRSISSRLSATLGTEYLRTYKTNRINFDVDPYVLYTNRSGDYTMLSHYLQTDWDVTGALRLVAGTRLDDHSVFGGNWSPRVAAVYTKSPKTTYKLLYGEALRMPSISEAKTDANPYNLRPEKINTTEFVWDQQVGETGHLTTSLFGYNMSGLIRIRGSIPANRDDVTSRGIETQYDYRLRNGAAGYLGLTVMRAESSRANYELPSSPHCLITSGMSVPVFKDKAYLATEVQYSGRSGTNLGNVAGAYAIANLALTSSSLVKDLSFSIGVKNLFNTSYVLNARSANDQDVLPQPKRMLQFQISYSR